MAAEPTPAPQSGRIRIHRTTEKDLPDLIGLWNDGRVMRWVEFPEGLGYDIEKAAEWFGKLEENSSRHHFVIHEEATGFCGELYYRVEAEHKRAGLDIKLVPEAQGRGIATEALKALIDFVFENEAEVEAVWTQPSEANLAARGLYRRCGLGPAERPTDLEGGESYWQLTREEWREGQD